MSEKPYSLIIFDWDGTLMDSAAHIVDCMQAAISELQVEARSDEQIRDIIGLGLEEAVLKLYPDADHAFIHNLAAAYRNEFLFKNKQKTELFTGVRDVLEQLKAQAYDLAVATGKSRRGLDKVLKETQLESTFPITRCADETFSKPNPLMLEEILTDYNTTVDQALMIGDSEYDIQMANNMGMDSLAVSYGVHELDRLMQHQPQGFINCMSELPTWLASRHKEK